MGLRDVHKRDARGRIRFNLGHHLRADISKTGVARVYQRAGRNSEGHSKHILRTLLDNPQMMKALYLARDYQRLVTAGENARRAYGEA